MSYPISKIRKKSIAAPLFAVIVSVVLTGCAVSGPLDSVFTPLIPHTTKQCNSIPVFVRYSPEHVVDIKNQNGRCVISVDGATENEEISECGYGAVLYRQSGTEVDTVTINRSCTFMVEMGNYGVMG